MYKFLKRLIPNIIKFYIKRTYRICRYQGFRRLLNLTYLKFLKFELPKIKGEDLFPLAVVIPCIRRDFKVLRLVLEGVIKNIEHPIAEVILVTPDVEECRKIFDEKYPQLRIIDESFLDSEILNFKLTVDGKDRSGWIKQQFIKLNVDKLTEIENVLVLDADTVFVKKTRFIHRGRRIFPVTVERHIPYYKCVQRLTGISKFYPGSFVCHHMVLNQNTLTKLKEAIATGSGDWQIQILRQLDKNQTSSFSEYELYGNFCYQDANTRCEYVFFQNTLITSDEIESLNQLETRFAKKKTNSVSSHHYILPRSSGHNI